MKKELGVYVHIPFCAKKCRYCDFYSVTGAGELVMDKFCAEVCRELAEAAENCREYDVTTVYFGGGTPSLIGVSRLEKIFDAVLKNYSVGNLTETTLEANPDSSGELREIREIGVNRISFGVQSLDDGILKKLGRIHTADGALRALERAREIFPRVNADLILGVDEKQDSLSDAEKIKDFVDHFSVYMLKLEEDTPLYKAVASGGETVPGEDFVVDAYEKVYGYLERNGFLRYEVSNFAKKGRESRHNLNCWHMKDYIGAGPSAHSYFMGERYRNAADLVGYTEGKRRGNELRIFDAESGDGAEEEFIMLALRTVSGLNAVEYKKRFGRDFSRRFSDEITRLSEFLDISKNHISIKPRYFLLQNSIISEFFIER